MLKILSFILILTTLNCYSKESPLFSFAIFSDNHGDGTEKTEFNKMKEWIESNDYKFVIGMGDHVQVKAKNSFIELINKNEWWKKNFYPTIADNENGYYGKSQADWGSGIKLFDLTDIKDRKNVKFAENGVEYYAVLTEHGINIHFISLHYPDQPNNDSIAFRESSKKYMMNIINGIDKKENDIIIIGAHSRLGYWLDRLNTDQKKIVNSKADLILSSTTHVFHIFSENGDDGPLVVNTGSVSRPRLWGKPGFLAVDVYNDPLRMDLSYIDCSKSKIDLPRYFFKAVKIINGRIKKN